MTTRDRMCRRALTGLVATACLVGTAAPVSADGSVASLVRSDDEREPLSPGAIGELVGKLTQVGAALRATGGNDALAADVHAMVARLVSGTNLPSAKEVESLVKRARSALSNRKPPASSTVPPPPIAPPTVAPPPTVTLPPPPTVTIPAAKPPKPGELRELASKVSKLLAVLQARGGNEALIAEVQAMVARVASGTDLPTKDEVESLLERVKDALEKDPDGDRPDDDGDDGDDGADDDGGADDGGADTDMDDRIRLGRARGEIAYLVGRLDPSVPEQAAALDTLVDVQRRIATGERVPRAEVREAIDAAVRVLADEHEKARTVLSGVITVIEGRRPEIADQLRQILDRIGEGNADEVRRELEAVRLALIERYVARLTVLVDRLEAALGGALTADQAQVIGDARAILALPAAELTKERLREVRTSLQPVIDALLAVPPPTMPVDTTVP